MSTSIENKHHHINETTASNSAERGFHGFSGKEKRGLDFDLNEPMINKNTEASLPCIDVNLVPISQVNHPLSIYLFIKKICYDKYFIVFLLVFYWVVFII